MTGYLTKSVVAAGILVTGMAWSDRALAQEANTAWVKLCETAPLSVPGKDGKTARENRKICLTHHERLDGNTGSVLISTAIRQVEGQSSQHFMALVPLGMSQAPGMRVRFHNSEQWSKVQRGEKLDDAAAPEFSLKYSLCHNSGCTAETALTPKILADMRSSAGMTVLAVNAQGQVVAFPVPLSGFNAAYDGAPVDNEVYSKARRKLLADIAKRKQALATKGPQVQAPTEVQPAPSQSFNLGRRVALVIGNSRYSNAGLLINPENDARAVAVKLRALGFSEVRERLDLTLTALNAELKTFGDVAANSDWAVIFFAGHGVQVDGVSYVLPVDVALNRASHINDEAVPLDRLLQKVTDARQLKLVILDACRNNPFLARMIRAGGTRSLSRGLASVEPTGGVLVAYATRDGQIAEDGSERNSPFTTALLRHMDEPNPEIGLFFRRVRDSVITATKGSQEPFVYGSLPGVPYYFRSK